jgi:thiol:disulfide interchange protein DsbC
MMKRALQNGLQVAGMLLGFGVLSLAVSSTVCAAEADEIQAVRAVLKQLMPSAEADRVSASPLPGMYEVVFGSQVIYVSKDGRYMLQGDLLDLQARENLTEVARRDGRMKAMQTVDPKTMVVFAPEQTKYVVNAFTDIDCGYCRKLHSRIAEYNALGIEIRYLAYPRSGVDTPSYYKAVTVWCADNQQAALTEAKAGENLPNKECDNPVKQHMALGQQVGVSGTPTLVLENGQVIPGYVEPQRLLQILEEASKG